MPHDIVFDVPFATSDDHREKEAKCLELWQRTIGYVNHVLETHTQLDLVQFKTKVHPSVQELRDAIDKARILLDLMATLDGLTHGAANTLLNCSRAIAELGGTFDSVVEQDQAEYNLRIARLEACIAGPI